MGLDVPGLEAMRHHLAAHYRVSLGTDADDLAAEVIATAAQQIEVGAELEPAYVWQLARWRANDHYRRRAALHESPAAITDTHATPIVEPDEGLSESTELALDAMTPLQRAAVLLKAEGYRQREIADRLGCSVDAVKKIVLRARESATRGRPRSWLQKLRLAERELDWMIREEEGKWPS